MQKKNALRLSVIVPAYKQAKTIAEDIRNIVSTLEKIEHNFELLVVVDGKIDTTYDQAKKVSSPKVHVLAYEKNHGKGYAVRYGMVRAKGDLVAFIDAGMDINPLGIKHMLELMDEKEADIVVGSKRHPSSQVRYPMGRQIVSFGGQLLTLALFGLNVRDTQVGLKLFRRKVLEDVLPRLLVKRFAFDIELLAVARYLGYDRIIEAPIELSHNFTSSVDSKAIVHTFIDTLAIFYRLRILQYYSDKNKRAWVYDPDLDYKVNIG